MNSVILYGVSPFQVVGFNQLPVRKFRGVPRDLLREDGKYEENCRRRSKPRLVTPWLSTETIPDIRKSNASNRICTWGDAHSLFAQMGRL